MRDAVGRLRRLATWARSRPTGPGRGGVPPAPPLQRRDARSPSDGAQYSVLCQARTAACSTTSSPTGSATTASSRSPTRPTTRRTSRGSSSHARELRRRRVHDRAARLRDARGPGPGARATSSRSSPTASCRSASAPRALTVAGAPDVLVCGTGYTGEDGVELLLAPGHAPAVWDALIEARRDARRPRRARHAAPRGLLPPLRQRPVRGPRPDRGRPRLVLQGGHGLHRRRGDRAPRASTAPPRRSSRSPSPARASPARATRSTGGGEVTSRHAVSPCLDDRHRHGLRARPRRPSPGTPFEIDVRGKPRPAEVRDEAPLHARRTDRGRGQLSRRPQVPRRARLGAHRRRHRRRSGITWYAQDQLGEVVFFDPPEVGTTVTQGPALRRGRVGQGRLRRDRAAVAARSSRSTRRSGDAPEQINEDPYGEGWLVKVRLSRPVARRTT